jgi:hypothetical protein
MKPNFEYRIHTISRTSNIRKNGLQGECWAQTNSPGIFLMNHEVFNGHRTESWEIPGQCTRMLLFNTQGRINNVRGCETKKDIYSITHSTKLVMAKVKNTCSKTVPHFLLPLSVRGTEVFFFRQDLRTAMLWGRVSVHVFFTPWFNLTLFPGNI